MKIGRLWQLVLFLFGAVLHVGFLHWYARLGYQGSTAAYSPETAPMVVAVSLTGGLSVWFFLSSFARQALEVERPALLNLAVRGALYGTSATFVATEAIFILVAVFIARGAGSASRAHWVSDLLPSFAGVQTYGAVVNLSGVVLGAAYGGLGGLALCALRRGRPPLATLVPRGLRLARACVATGVIGLLFSPFIIPGALASVLALTFGLRAVLHRRSGGAAPWIRIAYAGIGCATAGLIATAFWIAGSLRPSP